ncbi:MAG: epoxyqueuosine reductase QueH [Epsilonproteobacteria bacterium]|nr:diacylglucosamine hydrolase like protein [Campylobacterota bacterium]NPA56349.1 epoxyqueuosine reductase QueH [Campylobacterota bacterium]
MVVHICCSVDSHFFLERLRREFPEEELVAFFYDPNIHPYSEYRLRLLDVERSCRKLGIPLIEGEYDYDGWLQAVRGLEREPEKGERCRVCFDRRLRRTAEMARELGERRYTTTLLVSPLKSQEQLKESALQIDRELGTEFLFVDYRSGGGTQEQGVVTKRERLYRQNYCGCLFGLSQQRAQQERIADELMEPVTRRVLPGSVAERLSLYQKRIELEERGIPYEIVRESFLNYRLLRGAVRVEGEVVPSYIVGYSLLRRKGSWVRVRVEFVEEGIAYCNRDEVRLLDLESLNRLLASRYRSVKELAFRGLDYGEELGLREILGMGCYNLSPLIVLDKIPTKLEISIDAVTYRDVRQKLLIRKTYA